MTEIVSRRHLIGWLGVAAAAITAPVLLSEPADAQTAGMMRRENRREGRRMGRVMRREGRRDARAVRRAYRRGM